MKETNMQNEKNSDDSAPSSTTQHHRPWYKSQALAASIFCIAFISWIFSLLLVDDLQNPTLVILRSDACTYMRYHNISTNSYPAEGACTIEVQFFPDLISNGGVMKINGHRLDISENQIIAKEKIEDRPYPRTSSTEMPNVGAHGFAAHHAIINTMESCPERLSEDARIIFRMVHLNGIMQMIGEATLNVRKLVFDISGEIFSATDYWVDPLKIHDAGWLLCDPDQHTPLENNHKTAMFKPGDRINATLRVERKQTVSPERYTESELLRHMASAGIGTEATRVEAINTLVKDQVAKRTEAKTGRSLVLSPTEIGMHLIDRLPPSITGSAMENMLRNALKNVRSGQASLSGHLHEAFKWLTLTIHGII
jgi:DNA topoisomerase IA